MYIYLPIISSTTFWRFDFFFLDFYMIDEIVQCRSDEKRGSFPPSILIDVDSLYNTYYGRSIP